MNDQINWRGMETECITITISNLLYSHPTRQILWMEEETEGPRSRNLPKLTKVEMAGRISWLHKPAPLHLSMVSLFFSPLFFLSPSSSPILSSLEGTLTSGRNHSPGHFIILQCQTLLGRQFFCEEFPQPWYMQGHSLSWLYNFSCSIFVFFYKRILMELNKLRTLVLHHLNNSAHWMDTVGRSGGACW